MISGFAIAIESFEIGIFLLKITISNARIATPDAKLPLAGKSFTGFSRKFAFFWSDRAAARFTGANKRVCADAVTEPTLSCLTSTTQSTAPNGASKARKGVLHMASPKDKEEKMNRMLNAWRTLAPDKTFGGMTLAQFEAALTPSKAARQKIEDLDNQRTQAVTERDAADEVSADKMQLVVRGVLGDPDYGPDSALYEAFGYTRESERKSGLTRKGNQKPTT